MLIALQSLRLGGMNGEPQVYTEVHEDSLIALPIILPKVENTADDNVKRSTFSRPADAPDIESCKRSTVLGYYHGYQHFRNGLF